MLAQRLCALSRVSKRSVPWLRSSQRRWAQVHDVRFLVTHRQPDNVIEKYKEKLQKKAQEEGLNSVDELKSAYKKKIQAEKTKAAAPPSNPSQKQTLPFSPPPPPPPASSKPASPQQVSPTTPPAGLKTLSSYLDVSKTLDLPQQEIEYIWRLRHASNSSSLCAAIPTSSYNVIESTARRFPQFILPLPRPSTGAEIHFLQWAFPSPETATVLFTHLAEYKLRGEYSQPHTTVTWHTELKDAKGLVLMRGEVMSGRGVSVEEGKWLVMCLQRFYGGGGEIRRGLVESFGRGDKGFKIEDLVEEAEKIV
ncbi:MAG: hypothetical protein Q9214_005206 [Letrouitia sp. 1 TL-2023]